MPEEITLPTLSSIGLKMDYGIGSNVRIAAQYSPCGTIHLRVKDHLEKENKYTFCTFAPRREHCLSDEKLP